MADNKELTFVDKVSSESVAKTSHKSGPELVEYRALVDLSYSDKSVPAGDIVDDIPKSSIGWLLDGNYIEKVS